VEHSGQLLALSFNISANSKELLCKHRRNFGLKGRRHIAFSLVPKEPCPVGCSSAILLLDIPDFFVAISIFLSLIYEPLVHYHTVIYYNSG